MPARSAVLLLPQQVREGLDRKLIAGGFAGYESLSKWLEEQGFEISKSSLHRYGEKFEERIGALKIATEQARAIVAETPDDENAMTEALFKLVQERLFTIVRDMEIDPDKVNVSSLAKSIGQLGRASIAQKKYQNEVREKAKAAAEAVTKIARDGGMSNALETEIRNRIMGIVK